MNRHGRRLRTVGGRTAAFAGSVAVGALALLFWGGARVGAAGDQIIRVTPLARDGMVLVSFVIDEPVSADLGRSIQSGLPTTFTYDVELRRASVLWFDGLIGSARIAATVRFDNLTRRYQVSLEQDGRLAEARSTESAEAVKRWVSVFHRLPLFSTRQLRRNAEYYVRVRGRTSPRNTWSFWPWSSPSASGSAKFTFLP